MKNKSPPVSYIKEQAKHLSPVLRNSKINCKSFSNNPYKRQSKTGVTNKIVNLKQE